MMADMKQSKGKLGVFVLLDDLATAASSIRRCWLLLVRDGKAEVTLLVCLYVCTYVMYVLSCFIVTALSFHRE